MDTKATMIKNKEKSNDTWCTMPPLSKDKEKNDIKLRGVKLCCM